jgi:hypothetical protein
MDTVNLYLRLTHKYVDSYRHLDESRYIGTIKLTPPRQTREGNGHDDLGDYVRFGRIPRGLDPKEVERAVSDTLSHWGCSHEYDCCGCLLTRSDARVRGRTLMVHTSVGRNY